MSDICNSSISTEIDITDNELILERLDPKAVLPEYKDGVLYFYSCGDHTLNPSIPYYVPTGFKCKVPDGYILEISSFPCKTRLHMLNSPEYITKSDGDSELEIRLIWNGCKYYKTKVKHGTPIAKGILKKVEKLKIVEI